jgi:hypothetical protein
MTESKRQWLMHAVTFCDSGARLATLRRQARGSGLRLMARKQNAGGWLVTACRGRHKAKATVKPMNDKHWWLACALTFTDSQTRVDHLRREAKRCGLLLTSRKQDGGGWLLMCCRGRKRRPALRAR